MRPLKTWEAVILQVGGTEIIARPRTDGANQHPGCPFGSLPPAIHTLQVHASLPRMVCVTKRIWQMRWYAMSELGARTIKLLSWVSSLIWMMSLGKASCHSMSRLVEGPRRPSGQVWKWVLALRSQIIADLLTPRMQPHERL